MPLTKRETASIAVNSATDPGVSFNIGNAIMNFSNSITAGAINVGAGALCLSIRVSSELKKHGIELPLPKIFNKMVENPGAALATNGALLTVSGAVAATNIDPARPETALPAIISGGFGTGNFVQGIGIGLKAGGAAQRLINGYAQVAYASSLVLASSDAPLPVKMIFVFSGVAGVAAAGLNRQSLGPLSPNLLNASGALSSAFTNPNPVMMAANAVWAVGNTSLHLLLTRGGVAEIFKRKTQGEEASELITTRLGEEVEAMAKLISPLPNDVITAVNWAAVDEKLTNGRLPRFEDGRGSQNSYIFINPASHNISTLSGTDWSAMDVRIIDTNETFPARKPNAPGSSISHAELN